MKISVIVVTRNRAASLIRCLQSIMGQHYNDYEVIVVDNASEDDTVAQVAVHFPEVKLIRHPLNSGAPEGRNIGISHANGEICVCLDDDAELVSDDILTRCATYFEENPKLGCISMRVINEKGQIIKKLIPRRDRKIIDEDVLGALFSATGCAFRKSAFMKAGQFWPMLNPYFGEEPDLSYRLLDKGFDILQTPFMLVRHYHVPCQPYVSRRLYFGTRNTPWFAIRNLPIYSVVGLTILAWGYFFLVSLKNLQVLLYFKALVASIRGWPEAMRKRQPISKTTQRFIWKKSGLILW